MFEAARDLLYDTNENAVSGRMWLQMEQTNHGPYCIIKTRGIKKITKRWQVPTFIMDATLPDIDVLRKFYPNAELVADISISAPERRVHAILGAPISKGRLFDD